MSDRKRIRAEFSRASKNRTDSFSDITALPETALEPRILTRACVLNGLVWRRRRIPAHAVPGGHYHHIEDVPGSHAGITALARAECERARRIAPMDRNRRVRPALVIVAVARIFVQREVAVGSGINTQLDWIGSLACILDQRAERQNRSRANRERNAVKRSRSDNRNAARGALAGPEVVPIGTSRQILRP